jgi:hypothetical protein
MPATVTLGTTTLGAPVGPSDDEIKVASTSGIRTGMRLFVSGELMEVLRLGVDPFVKVRRGVDSTRSVAHPSAATVYVGQAHQFYTRDPVGRPPAAIEVSPWINVLNGKVWFAQGDTMPGATADRWWQEQAVARGTSALGVRTATYDPTTSS